MQKDWQTAYSELTKYIANHPEIKISGESVSIPKDVRIEFYRLFDTIRRGFVEQELPDINTKAKTLNQQYLLSERNLIEQLKLEEVCYDEGIDRFLHNIMTELIAPLRDPLFDLLKGKTEIDQYCRRAVQAIETSIKPLFLVGYEKWLAFSLVRTLEAASLFRVIPRDTWPMERYVVMAASPQEQAPTPTGTNSLILKRHKMEEDPLFILPDLIVFSNKIGGYFSLKQAIGNAVLNASNESPNREWFPFDARFTDPGLTLIYLSDNINDLSLVADAEKICRPDLMIECQVQKNWYNKDSLERIKLRNGDLKPKLGTYIVCWEEIPERAMVELQKHIGVDFDKTSEEINEETGRQRFHFLNIGLDESKLEPIVSALIMSGNQTHLHLAKGQTLQG